MLLDLFLNHILFHLFDQCTQMNSQEKQAQSNKNEKKFINSMSQEEKDEFKQKRILSTET